MSTVIMPPLPSPESRPCGARTTVGGRCTHLVSPGATRCAALHVVNPSWSERRAAKRAKKAGDNDLLAAESGTLDADDFMAEFDAVIDEEPKPLTAEQLLAQEELLEKRRLAEIKSQENAERISAILPENVITLDLDGTMFDSWACCKKKETNWVGSEECRHLRQDTLDAARELAEEHDAALVVLSWRGGLDKLSREWIGHIGLDEEIMAVFIPSGEDDITGHHTEITSGTGQVDFKVNTVKRLQDLGHNVVASFDDRNTVVKALEAAGSKNAIQVKYKYSVATHEWSAGYIGAPKRSTGGYHQSRWADEDLFGVGPRKGRSRERDPYGYGDSMWDDDERRYGDSGDDMTRDEFDDLVDSGQAVHGRDYTIDSYGEVKPLRRIRDDWDDDGDLSDWVADRYRGRDDYEGRDQLIFNDAIDLDCENPF